jgi:hypothetical protein
VRRAHSLASPPRSGGRGRDAACNKHTNAFDALRELSTQFLAIAQKQGATVPLIIGHRLMAHALLLAGDISESRTHYNQALIHYDPAVHRSLAMRLGGQDAGVATLSHRSWAMWMLGYPQAALADAEHALKDAREIGHAATLMYALNVTSDTHIYCAKYVAADALEGSRNAKAGLAFCRDRQSLWMRST